MPYKVGFKLDNGKTLWLKQTYAHIADAEKAIKDETATLRTQGIRIASSHIAKIVWGIYSTFKNPSKSNYFDTGWYTKSGTFALEEPYAMVYKTKEEAVKVMNTISFFDPSRKYEVKEIKKTL